MTSSVSEEQKKERERACALSRSVRLWKPRVEHPSEGDRNELQRSAGDLDLVVPGLEERLESAQGYRDAASEIPSKIVFGGGAATRDADRRVVPTGATNEVRRHARRRYLVNQVARDAGKMRVSTATFAAELVIRCVDPNPERNQGGLEAENAGHVEPGVGGVR